MFGHSERISLIISCRVINWTWHGLSGMHNWIWALLFIKKHEKFGTPAPVPVPGVGVPCVFLGKKYYQLNEEALIYQPKTFWLPCEIAALLLLVLTAIVVKQVKCRPRVRSRDSPPISGRKQQCSEHEGSKRFWVMAAYNYYFMILKFVLPSFFPFFYWKKIRQLQKLRYNMDDEHRSFNAYFSFKLISRIKFSPDKKKYYHRTRANSYDLQNGS